MEVLVVDQSKNRLSLKTLDERNNLVRRPHRVSQLQILASDFDEGNSEAYDSTSTKIIPKESW